MVCFVLLFFPDHSHVEEVESDTIEAFAVSVCGQGGRAARGRVLAAVPWQRDDQRLQSLGVRPSRDLLGVGVVVLLVLGVNLGWMLVRLD